MQPTPAPILSDESDDATAEESDDETVDESDDGDAVESDDGNAESDDGADESDDGSNDASGEPSLEVVYETIKYLKPMTSTNLLFVQPTPSPSNSGETNQPTADVITFSLVFSSYSFVYFRLSILSPTDRPQHLVHLSQH